VALVGHGLESVGADAETRMSGRISPASGRAARNRASPASGCALPASDEAGRGPPRPDRVADRRVQLAAAPGRRTGKFGRAS